MGTMVMLIPPNRAPHILRTSDLLPPVVEPTQQWRASFVELPFQRFAEQQPAVIQKVHIGALAECFHRFHDEVGQENILRGRSEDNKIREAPLCCVYFCMCVEKGFSSFLHLMLFRIDDEGFYEELFF